MWSNLIRFAIAAACFVLLYVSGLLDFRALTALFHKPVQFAFCFLLIFATVPLAAYRWHLLLRHQDFHLPYWKTLAVVFVGGFFNTFLPGAYGGDIVRAGYIYHGARRNGGRLIVSILVDRLTGIAGLILLGLAAQVLLPDSLNHIVTIALVGLSVILLVGLALLMLGSHTVGRLMQRAGHAIGERIMRATLQVRTAVSAYIKSWPIIVAAVAISVFQFALILIALINLSSLFDFATVSASTTALAGIISLIANSIPLTPGGIGLGEAAYANAVRMLDPSAIGPYATIFLALRAMTLLVSLIGGIVFAFLRTEMFAYVGSARTGADPEAEPKVPSSP